MRVREEDKLLYCIIAALTISTIAAGKYSSYRELSYYAKPLPRE